jgi:hypothetical protein
MKTCNSIYFLPNDFRWKIDFKRNYLFVAIAVLVLQLNVVVSQEMHHPNVFQIQHLGIKYSESILHESLVKADWCQSINPTSNYKITFDDGAIVNVISYKELIMQHMAIEESCIRSEDL